MSSLPIPGKTFPPSSPRRRDTAGSLGSGRWENLLEVAAIAQDLESAAPAHAYKIVLVDTCRTESKTVSEVPSGTAPLTAVPQGVSVNYAVSAESKAFQGASGMSAWTERFVALANAYPYLEIDQFVKYANRYTDWQTRTMAGTQHPVIRFPHKQSERQRFR